MSARALLDAAAAEGLTLGVEGGNLVIETDRDPPAELLAELREHKGELLALLLATIPRCAAHRGRRACSAGLGGRLRRALRDAAADRLLARALATDHRRDRHLSRPLGRRGDPLRLVRSRRVRLPSDAPAARFDCMGLVLLLDRREVVAIDEHGADLVTVSGARQRFRRRPLPPGTIRLWELTR